MQNALYSSYILYALYSSYIFLHSDLNDLIMLS